MNERKTPFDELLLEVSNTSHECGAHDGTLDEYCGLHSMASAAKDAIREHVRQLELSRNEALAKLAVYEGRTNYLCECGGTKRDQAIREEALREAAKVASSYSQMIDPRPTPERISRAILSLISTKEKK